MSYDDPVSADEVVRSIAEAELPQADNEVRMQRAQITTAQREYPVHQWTACLCATKSIYTSLAARVTNNLL